MEIGAQAQCTICGSHQHVRSTCPIASTGISEGDEFMPLRKKLKRKSTGKEDNFMAAYYNEEESIATMSEQEVARLRSELGIEVEGDDQPRPIRHFRDAGLPEDLLYRLGMNGCIEPTAIQMQAIPCVMSGRDVIGIAQTGTGKTLAYVLPLLMFLRTRLRVQPGQGPYALILAPTRELAEQIHSEVQKYSLPSPTTGYPLASPLALPPHHPHYLDNSQSRGYTPTSSALVRTVLVTGGMPLPEQIEALASGTEVVIATPGRLLDLIGRGSMKMDSLSYLVFDEADRMLALEMEVQLREIVDKATICARQTLLFSATMGDSVMRLIRSAVLNPLTITVQGISGAPHPITQQVIFMHPRLKQRTLLGALRSIERPPVLIFCNNHHTVDKVVTFLKSEQFHVAGLHGEKMQTYRFQVMKAFKEEGLDVLVSTDLASRGIDVKDVSTVILYDIPETIESYIHRIGRTGRAGQSGRAIAFLTLECMIAGELKRYLQNCKQEIPTELQNTRQFGKSFWND